ncbi:MAG: metallophosphoesterase [Pseudomonadota bacterium]
MTATHAAQTTINASGDSTLRIGIVGDLHTHFDIVDVHQLNQLELDLLLFTGDLGSGSRDSCLEMARLMSGLHSTTLVMPGNNDTVDITQLAAELTHRSGQNAIMAIARQTQAGGAISLCGYSLHRLAIGSRQVSLITARPHSMGGPDLTFPDYMGQTYAIQSLDGSIERINALVDAADQEIIFLGHNGPVGLGDKPADMWGCDFKPDGGDWGDPDLAEAIAYARAAGKRILAVVAGHMHLRTKQGDERPWHQDQDGITYINAARVPRIFARDNNVYRHHILLTIGTDTLTAEEILLPEYD